MNKTNKMEPCNEAIAVRVSRLNRQILGKVTAGSTKFSKKTIDREALLDALTALYDECNDDPTKKTDELVRVFVDKYRSTVAELRRMRVCYSDFEVIQTIGRGYFGEVHMVREKQTSDVYALKVVKKELARKRVSGAEDERDVLANANSAWMPKLQYAFQDNTHLYLVMELCSGGDLAGLLARRNHPLSERDAAFYVCEVAHALKALHGMGYVHRDVKPHNILLDRCGHVKLGDFGSCARLSENSSGGAALTEGGAPATADYIAPELLAAAHCADTHAVCSHYCRGFGGTAISACDYWSLGVVAFELVTLRRPFSSDDEDSVAQILSNIQRYEREPDPQPPFEACPGGPSAQWRALVAGLLRVQPSRRYNYLDTLQHAALAHIPVHSIRNQPPPWVPCVRGAEDASLFSEPPRESPPPSAAPFRTRLAFAGQLPFVGYSYVAPDDNEDSTGGFNASHDCTAIDLATFKSAEKLAAMRGREISSLQSKLAAAEAATCAAAERARRDADVESERTRARLQADITALTLQNKRLERQIEVEKEERMALQRTNQELSMGVAERASAELRMAKAEAERAIAERESARTELARLESRVEELQAELKRAVTSADMQRAQHQHYKDILEQVQHLHHRRLTELNVRPVDSVAKERAIRRQTLSGGEAEQREMGSRLATAEANLARETRSRESAEKQMASLQNEYDKIVGLNKSLQTELDEVKRRLACAQESVNQKQRAMEATEHQLNETQTQLAQEKVRVSGLQAQVQELERAVEAAVCRETAVEEQCARTEARLNQRLQLAEERAALAAAEDARHREKVTSLEQLVRQLEREVSALEARGCVCGKETEAPNSGRSERDARSDTESVGEATPLVNEATPLMSEAANAQVELLKEQLAKAENQLQTRAEEIATLRQETRAANLARWRKEREYNELSVEAKSAARDLKRMEDRLTAAVEARRKAEQKAAALESEIATLRPQYERARQDVEHLKSELDALTKTHETAQAEVDRSRNDIRKLKCELQYSERRRLHAEQQEEQSARERAELRDEVNALRRDHAETTQNNKALQEACAVLEEQLTDLEKLCDIHEVKNKDLEMEVSRLREELDNCRAKLELAQKQATEYSLQATRANAHFEEISQRADQLEAQLTLYKDKLEAREQRITELESTLAELEARHGTSEAAVHSAARRLRDLQEECAALRTRAHDHHASAMQLQVALADAQEELAAAREAAEAATAWWRTRETKTDATLRQQAKLIDFLQAKLEEANRKKCSLGHKLFGRSGRRNGASPPLRRINMELREEVDRLRAKLSATNSSFEINSLPPTPRREKTKHVINGERKSMDVPDGSQNDDTLLIVWPDGSRERMHAKHNNGDVTLSSGERQLTARLLAVQPTGLTQNEANRAFVLKVDKCIKGDTATVICDSIAARAEWVSRLLISPAVQGFTPRPLAQCSAAPLSAMYLAADVVAIGCTDGLRSLRGAVRLTCSADSRRGDGLACLAAAAGRALLLYNGTVLQGSLVSLVSTLRRAESLHPSFEVTTVRVPEGTAPHLVKAVSGEQTEGVVVGVACGRRVFLLRFDAALSQFKVSRSLTVDRAPNSILLTPRTVYIAGEKPLKVNLPSGVIESFAMEEPTIAALAKKHSPPRSILLIQAEPVEILICYSECGVFLNEFGRKTRNEEPKWSSKVHGWEFVKPFLYVVGEDKVSIIYLNDEAYRSPPCTCDNASLHSSESECFSPEVFQLKIREPFLLGTAPHGIIVRSKTDDGYQVSLVEGISAFKSIGASIESIDTVTSDAQSSATDLARSSTDLREENGQNESRSSEDSVEGTGFLADIRNRARQLRSKQSQQSDEVIEKILRSEVGLHRVSNGRRSATTSDAESDSTESGEKAESKGTSDLCAEMFARQVRFQ